MGGDIEKTLKVRCINSPRNSVVDTELKFVGNNASPKPIFYTDEDRLSFTTTLLIHPEFENDSVNDSVNDRINQSLNETEQEIYNLVKENDSISIPCISNKPGISESTVNRAIKKLKALNFIAREGAKKNGKWIILK